MARTLLVAGTASHVGKSTVVAGLCRRLARADVSVAPFKAQNMSNNARAVVTPGGDWGEIGVSQYVQARAASVPPTTDMNPVLLKPRGDAESQVVIHGNAIGHYDAGSYYADHWERARRAAIESYERLAADHEVIVAEGAGSIAEINLHERDLANVETSRFADAEILLVGDVERGGVFASLVGTLELVPDDVRERITGIAISKFRGDPELLESGITELESRTNVPVVGVLPYHDPGLPEEDSVSLPSQNSREVRGRSDGRSASESVTIGVPRLPHISNFTDLKPLARSPGVRVEYLPLDAGLEGIDGLVLPGTKNTVDDRLALEDSGFDSALDKFRGPIVGICGGYQLLGERITNASIESARDEFPRSTAHTTGEADAVDGLGLLPVETRFESAKRVRQVTLEVTGVGPIAGASGTASGYEIHMGRTEPIALVDGDVLDRPLGPDSAATESVLGTYLHGIFENHGVREAFLDSVFNHAGVDRPDQPLNSHSPYDAAAALMEAIDESWLSERLGRVRRATEADR